MTLPTYIIIYCVRRAGVRARITRGYLRILCRCPIRSRVISLRNVTNDRSRKTAKESVGHRCAAEPNFKVLLINYGQHELNELNENICLTAISSNFHALQPCIELENVFRFTEKYRINILCFFRSLYGYLVTSKYI